MTGAVLSMLSTVQVVTSETFPAASTPRKDTTAFCVNVRGCVYSFQFAPSVEYSFTTESSLKVAATSTGWFVLSVMLLTATGASGATVSMLSNWICAVPVFPASSVVLK